MTLRRLWTKLRLDLHEFQTIEKHSQLYRDLVASGISSKRLNEYIAAGRGRKRQGCAIPVPGVTAKQVRELVRLGGSVAGGAALRAWLNLGEPRDYDVFFSDMPSFVAAHLTVYDNPLIDVCLYENQPYELFDLAASKCSYSSKGFRTDSSFDETMGTGISDIELGAIVHPLATLRRVIKYGSKYDLKFPFSKVLMLATTQGVDKRIAGEALNYAV